MRGWEGLFAESAPFQPQVKRKPKCVFCLPQWGEAPLIYQISKYFQQGVCVVSDIPKVWPSIL